MYHFIIYKLLSCKLNYIITHFLLIPPPLQILQSLGSSNMEDSKELLEKKLLTTYKAL